MRRPSESNLRSQYQSDLKGAKGMVDQIKEEIRQYILTEFLPGEKASNLHDDTPLRTSGIIDSTGLLRLIDFIEGRFNIQVEAYEAGVENFDRIQDLASFIAKKQNPGA